MAQIKYTKGKQSKLPFRFFLHYVGSGLYSVDIFEKEAKKYGVQRALPFTHIKRFSFGTPILLARYIKPLKTVNSDLLAAPISTVPQAEVFGYFTIDGISHNLDKDLSKQLYEKLNIVKVDASPFGVSRACGSYSVASVAYVKDSLSDIIQKVEEMFTSHEPELTVKDLESSEPETLWCNCPKCEDAKEIKGNHERSIYCLKEKCSCCTYIRHGDINSHKWFVNGKYYPLTPFILSPAKFARGIIEVTIKDLNLEKQKMNPHAVVMLYNYKQRHYLNSSLRLHFENNTKNKFFEET